MTSNLQLRGGGQETAAQDSGTKIIAAWQAMRKNWLLLVAVFGGVLVLSALYTTRQQRIYRAVSVIEIDPNPPRPLGGQVQAVVDVGAGAYWTNREYYETQLKVIQGRSLAEEVVTRLQLQRDPGFLDNVKEKTKRASISVEAAAGLLQRRIIVEPIKNSRLVQISLEDADPKRAKRILTELLNTYLERNLDSALEAANSASTWLGDQMEKLKAELERREIELHDFKREKQILSVSLTEQTNMLRAEMTQLNERLTAVRAQTQGLSARNTELQNIKVEDPTSIPATELLRDGTLQSLRTQYLNAETEYSRLLATGKGTDHPVVLGVAAQVQSARTALFEEVRNLQGAAARDLRIAQHEVDGLLGLFKAAEQRGMDLGLLEIQYKRLERDKDNTERLYTIVLERDKDSDVTRLLRFNNLRIIDKPSDPGAPVRPSLPSNLAIGSAFGLVLGLGLVLGRETLDRSIRSPEHLSAMGVPFLGLLPRSGDSQETYQKGVRKRRRGRHKVPADAQENTPPELAVHSAPRSGIAEASRAIRTNVRFMSPDRPFKSLLVTSASPSEGKTTVACCLAVAMAQAGDRVLLLDCDLRRPRLHRVFKRDNAEGVTTLLLDPSTFNPEALLTTVPNLSVLPSGPHAPNPAELVNSERFVALLRTLGQHYDRIVIDSPPVAPVTDAAILSTRVDATVLVVRAFKTSKEVARRSLQSLRDVGAPLAGAVLNAVEARSGRGYYYYDQYTYGYGQAEAEAAESASPTA